MNDESDGQFWARLTSQDQTRDAERIREEIVSAAGGSDPFAAAARATRMPMIITNPREPDNPVVFANAAFCRMSGYHRDEIVGRNCRFLQGPQTDPAAVARIREAVRDARSIEIDIRNHRKNGDPFWNRLLMAPVRDASGTLTYFFASQVDVTIERERLAGLENHNAALMAEVAGRLHQMQDSEARLRFATEAGRFGVWELDLRSRDLMMSPLVKHLLGRSEDAVLDEDALQKAIHADDRASFADALARSIATGRDYDVEVRVVQPDGAIVWAQIRGQVLQAADGTSLRIAGIMLDITGRKVAEIRRLALVELADRFRDLEDPADIAYAASEILGRTLGVSRAGYGTIDPIAETITIERDWNAPGIETLAGTLRFRDHGSYIDDLKRGETVLCTDAYADPRTADTADVLAAISARSFINMPVTEQDGFVALLYLNHAAPRQWPPEDLAFLRDIADRTRTAVERRRAERDLRESEEHYRHAVELNPQVAWTATPDGRLDRIAERWREWTGIAGLDGSWTLGLHPDDRDFTAEAWTRSVTFGLPLDVEHRVMHRSGEVRWARSRAFPRRHNAHGDIVKWYGTTEDIHERKLAEAALHELNNTLEQHVVERTAELEQAQAALRQSQKMEAVGQLTGGIAHDFNNLLTGITGSLELIRSRLAQGRLSAVERYMLAAEGAAKRAAALTQRLLAFSRRQTLDPKPTDINRLIAAMEDLIRRTVGPSVAMEVVGAGGLWTTLIDPHQLDNALLNLCINARDAMPDGGRLMIETANKWLDDRAAAERDLPPGQYVSLCVSDTGTGMSPEVIARAFDPFFTTKPLGVGTGLGLSMIYGFVRQSGGQVRIYSEVGAGTTMCLYLPRHYGEALDSEAFVSSAAQPQAQVGETVLVVDDEPTVRMLVTEILADAGYAAIEAADGASALKVLESNVRIDLLISDVGLPGGMNGRQLADAGRVLRAGLKVLFITGYAENAAVGNGHLEPGMQVVTKPFAMDAMARKIREML